VNLWLIGCAAMLPSFLICFIVMLKGRHMDALVAMEFANVVAVFCLLLMAVGFNQPSFTDLALVLALLNLPSNLVFAHFLERWI
jgi:multisubunit Na+/H+ antiporter MnhF subunit